MKVRQIVEAGIQSQKDFLHKLKIRRLLNEYAVKNDITKLYSLVHERFDPVFVLSTGRCGTAFLTYLLKTDKNIEALHEPEPEFFYHTLLAYNECKINPEKIKAVFDVARYELIRNVFISGKKYIETNNRVTFFAHQIAELYPNSKFIHLVRNPTSVIKSGLARNWYTGNTLYDEGRIISGKDDWKHFSQIEKIGWLWKETNNFIEEFKKQNSSDRILFVKAENLFKSQEEQLAVLKFVNAAVPSSVRLKNFANKKINEGKKNNLSNEQRKEVERVVEIMKLNSLYNY